MSARRRCTACGKLFGVRPQVSGQSYFADEACQRERKKLWQRDRSTIDPDYPDNQARAQEAWLARNPDYWRGYPTVGRGDFGPLQAPATSCAYRACDPEQPS